MYYNKNIFFLINNKYYIYIYEVNNKYIYTFETIDDILFLFIKNKDIDSEECFKLKIMYDKKEYIIELENEKSNVVKLGNIDNFNYYDSNIQNINEQELTDSISINNTYMNDTYINDTYINNYIENNSYIKDIDKNNKKFILYHWYLCGQYDAHLYFKYLLHKYNNIILNLNYSKLKYSNKNNNTLLFIDNRHDSTFIYLLILFIFSVDSSWNINIITTKEKQKFYQNDLNTLDVTGKITILNEIGNYSELLKKSSFWKNIKEDNCLLFQYDSFCMGKFDNIFLNYNYIGAKWKNEASNLIPSLEVGNGGTSFRKTRIMEYLSDKYKNSNKNSPEDVFFAELLYEEYLYTYNTDIANRFSFENIYNDNSIYGHQIYKSISHDNLDNFMYKKLIKLSKMILR